MKHVFGPFRNRGSHHPSAGGDRRPAPAPAPPQSRRGAKCPISRFPLLREQRRFLRGHNTDQRTARFDQSFGNRHKAFFRYSLNAFVPGKLMVEALTPENYVLFITDPYYLAAFTRTLRVAVIVTGGGGGKIRESRLYRASSTSRRIGSPSQAA